MNLAYVNKFKGAKVLICDDDPTHQLLMREVLQADGFVVIDALNGEDALHQYYAQTPDIILLDVDMPKLDGFYVCKEIRSTKYGKDIPILMVTGAGDTLSIEMAFEAGATDFLPKPIKWPLMAHRVAYLLNSSQAIVDLQNSENRLSYLAYFDPLTGLANKQNLVEYLNDFLPEAALTETNIAMLEIELGYYQSAYHALGHSIAQKFMQEISDVIEKTLQDPNIEIKVARTADDRFTISFIHFDNPQDILNIVDKLIAKIKQPIEVEEYQLSICPQLGISFFPEDGSNVDQLITRATIASNLANKNSVLVFSDKLNSDAFDALYLEQEIRQAIADSSLKMQYKCIGNDDVLAPTILQAEAVWIGSDGQEQYINKYLEQISHFSLKQDVENWMIEQVCEYLQQQSVSGEQVTPIAIKLSSERVLSAKFNQNINTIKNTYGIANDLLCIEVNDVLLSNPKSRDVLATLRNNGMLIMLTLSELAPAMKAIFDLSTPNFLSLTDEFIVANPNLKITFSDFNHIFEKTKTHIIFESETDDELQEYLIAHGLDICLKTMDVIEYKVENATII